MKQDVAFVIVAYRPNKGRLRSLQSALADYPVITIDNTTNNRGYAGGANAGIKKALEGGAKWIVVLNQDISMSKNATVELATKVPKAKSGIAGPFAGGLDPRRWTTILPSKRVDYITGSCIAIHRDVIEKVGDLHEPYFLYYEEADLCVRAKHAGFPLTHIPVKGITHEESVSLGKGSVLHQYYLARNHLLFVERCAPAWVKLYEYLRMSLTILEHVQKRESGALTGIRDYFFRSFGSYNRGV